MGLSSDLDDVDLTMRCFYCGHPLVKPGRWFRTVSRFTCEKCQTTSRISYPDKVALFARHTKAFSESGSRGGSSPRVTSGRLDQEQDRPARNKTPSSTVRRPK
jgi:hypothetical protein